MTTIVSPRSSLLQDVVTVAVRELRPILLAPWALAFSLVQPLLLLAFFLPLLSLTGPGGSLQWFVPGVLVMLGLYETAGAGANLMTEARTGAHERMLVSPLRRSSLLLGRALKDLVPIVGQAVVVLAVVVPLGFRLHLPGALLGLAILGVLGIGIGALSYALALAIGSQEWVFWVTTQTLTFPLLVLSGLLLPLDGAPGWMAAAATANPLAHVAAAERALFAGSTAGLLPGVLAAVATAAVGLAVGVRVVRRGLR